MTSRTYRPLVRWYRLYYLLALFNVLVVLASLYFSHQSIRLFRSSLDANWRSEQRIESYSHLGRLAQRVNAPGSDVFDDPRIDYHEQRMREALAEFNDAITQRRRELDLLVSDDGMGIPRAAQARLFEKFFRADNAVSKEAEGTGLGLHLVRLVIEHAGGRVWCESEEGHGATFVFTLPVAQQQGEAA